MTKTTNEQGFISAVYEGKTHEDLHTCLFACFLSQEEPKKVIQALKDPSWIEAMQEELLQFKLQQVWTLVDLPHGKRAIGTKWVYMNKKDEKMLFLAYASFKDFVVYQMDVKSAFLYGKIEEEVLFLQPPWVLKIQSFPDKFIRKSTTGGCQFLRSRLISWQCKKKTIFANSTTEAEYVAAAKRELVRIKTDDGNDFWNEIGVNVDDSVNAAATLLLYCQQYALTVNLTIYTSCIKQFWATVRRALQLKDAEAQEEGEGSVMPNVPQHTPTINPPSTSKPQKKQSRRKQRKDTKVSQPSNPTEPMTDETENVESVPTHSNDLLFSGEDRLQLKELLELLAYKNQLLRVDNWAQTLIEIKAAKPKAVTTAATITTIAVTRPKARELKVSRPSRIVEQQHHHKQPMAKTRDKAKTIQPEKPLKKKDQILIEEIAQKLQAQLNAELEEEEKLAKQREEDANIAEWDNVQAMIDADYELAARLQAQEQEELTVEEKSKLFFQKAFDKTMGWIDSFVSMDFEVVKGGKEKDEGSVTRAEERSSKRAGIELEQERIKKQN
ncbi:putative ribonuclease H-like domain-containing protein [Tanacetum coccineum]